MSCETPIRPACRPSSHLPPGSRPAAAGRWRTGWQRPASDCAGDQVGHALFGDVAQVLRMHGENGLALSASRP